LDGAHISGRLSLALDDVYIREERCCGCGRPSCVSLLQYLIAIWSSARTPSHHRVLSVWVNLFQRDAIGLRGNWNLETLIIFDHAVQRTARFSAGTWVRPDMPNSASADILSRAALPADAMNPTITGRTFAVLGHVARPCPPARRRWLICKDPRDADLLPRDARPWLQPQHCARVNATRIFLARPRLPGLRDFAVAPK
jgi:hypothetical protein